jgi:uncharacterized protein YwgA
MFELRRRFRDVLYALEVANKYSQALGRLQLQKFIYLADTLSLVWDLASTDGYQTYKHGPYDSNVQNAVDVLSFRGAVDIAKMQYKAEIIIRVSYKISDKGIEIVENLRKDLDPGAKYELYEVLGSHVNARGWDSLKDLVYSEATFLTEKADGLGKPLNLNSFLSNQSFRILLGFNNLVNVPNQKLSRKNLVSIFFRVFDNYSANHNN